MSVLVDSSAWIDYFRGERNADIVDFLIRENLVVTNDLILAELVPVLHLRKQRRIIALLGEIKRYPITIDWDDVIQTQITCLRNGLNGIGVPDIIIAQHAIQNHLLVLASDQHFRKMSDHIALAIHDAR